MAAKNKYYAVKVGRIPGIYETWPECQKQVIKFPNASFKGFSTMEEAVQFMNKPSVKELDSTGSPEETIVNIYVDGSYRDGRYSWAFAVYESESLTYYSSGVGTDEEAATMNNVAGEIAGAVKAIQWAEENNKRPINICHDYNGPAHWADGSWRAKNKFTIEYAKFASSRLDWVRFKKVEGHSGVEGNELVDRLAKEALGITS